MLYIKPTILPQDQMTYIIIIIKYSLLFRLNIFNKNWISGNFPTDWRKTITIPSPKHGKDKQILPIIALLHDKLHL